MKSTLNEVSPPFDKLIQALLMANNTDIPNTENTWCHVDQDEALPLFPRTFRSEIFVIDLNCFNYV